MRRAATLAVTALQPGDAFTLWWVVFNAPEACTHGEGGLRCGEGDLLLVDDGDSAPSWRPASTTARHCEGEQPWTRPRSIR
jgi:hypothetical protein